MSQPGVEVVGLDAVHQQVSREAMPQGVCADPETGRGRVPLLGLSDRRSDPVPLRRWVDVDELSLVYTVLRECRPEWSLPLAAHRNDPGSASSGSLT